MQLDGKTIRVTGPAGTTECQCIKGYIRFMGKEAAMTMTLGEGWERFVGIMRGHTGEKWVPKGLGVTMSADGADFLVDFEYDDLEFDEGKIQVAGFSNSRRKPDAAEIARLRALKGKPSPLP